MQLLEKYFPALTPEQCTRFAALPALYAEWNAKVNLVSRQDIENLELRHVLHSLAIAKAFAFKPGAKVLDLGTGGGFPGVPLAILFPEVQFTLIDGTGKKIAVVQEVVSALGLENTQALHVRAEEMKTRGAFDFVVTRAVAPLDKLLVWGQPLLSKKHQHAYPNGIVALKGGDLRTEVAALPGRAKNYVDYFPVQGYFPEPWFEEKWVVYIQG
ncbi:MAG: 16S rRNA (guanine(527)-N(7))-methyltransferase RsmG [Saprospiraceae bacterium]